MTFWVITWVTEISVLSKQFCSIRCKKTSRPTNRVGDSRFTFIENLRKLLAIRKKSRETIFWEVWDFCFTSLSKFGSFKNPSAMITNMSELHSRYRRFILLAQTKVAIPLSYAVADEAKNNEDEWGLNNERYIHQFQPGSTHRI